MTTLHHIMSVVSFDDILITDRSEEVTRR